MASKKILAIVAVLVMLTAPLAVLAYDTDGATAEAKVAEQGTSISLKNLDREALETLFQIDEEQSNWQFSISNVGLFLAATFLTPDLNVFPFYMVLNGDSRYTGPIIEDWSVEGGSIDFNYYRTCTQDQEYTINMAVDVNVESYSITFHKDYMAAINKYMNQTGYYGDKTATMLISDYSIDDLALIIKNCFKEETLDDSVWKVLATILKSTSTGDYNTAIRDTYACQTYGKSALTVSGSIHAKLFVEWGSKVSIVTMKETGDDWYAVYNSGLTVESLLKNLSAEKEYSFGDMIPFLSMKKLTADVQSTATISQKELKASTIKTNLNFAGEFDRTFNYANDPEKILNADLHNDFDNLFEYNEYTKFIASVEPILKASVDSEFIVDEKGYNNNGMAIDCSDILRSIFDKQIDNAGVQSLFSASGPGYIRNFLPVESDVPGPENVDHAGFGYIFTADAEAFNITCLQFLNIFNHDRSHTNGDMTEKQAQDLIKQYGEFSFEPSVAKKNVQSIADSIEGKTSKDNSMLVLALVVIVIAILAIIAFAMIVRTKAH